MAPFCIRLSGGIDGKNGGVVTKHARPQTVYRGVGIFFGIPKHHKVGEWRGDVRVWCQPGAGILQYLCDGSKILVTIMER